MDGRDLELGELLTAAESAPPGESVSVIAHDLRKRFGAERVSFLFVDLLGQRLLRLSAPAEGDRADAAERVDLLGRASAAPGRPPGAADRRHAGTRCRSCRSGLSRARHPRLASQGGRSHADDSGSGRLPGQPQG